MNASRLFVVLFWTYLCVVHANPIPSVDTQRLLGTIRRSLPTHASQESLSKGSLGKDSQRLALEYSRRLQQSREPACEWTEEEECGISVPTIIDFLERADNPVADFVNRRLECQLAEDRDACTGADCSWVEESGCYVPHDETREFHEVECLEEVDHIIELRTGSIECRPRDTETECVASERCTWNTDHCRFDRWFYYYNIRTVNGFPQTFEEVFAARNLQLTNDIQDATERGDIGTFADLPSWEPPEFDCPVIYDELVCDYVEALTPFLVNNLYCSLQYESATDIISCNNDELCEATEDPDSVCGPSSDALTPALYQAELEFSNAIEDPEARMYEVMSTECFFIDEESECKGDCSWAEEQCILSNKWIEDEIHRLVGESDDPVCQYFTLGVETGCVDREGRTSCEEDPQCVYSDEFAACDVGFIGYLMHALELSGLLDPYVSTAADCVAQTEEGGCLDVEATRGRPRETEEDESGVFDIDAALADAEGPDAASPAETGFAFSPMEEEDELLSLVLSLPPLASDIELSVPTAPPADSESTTTGITDSDIGRIGSISDIFGFGR